MTFYLILDLIYFILSTFDISPSTPIFLPSLSNQWLRAVLPSGEFSLIFFLTPESENARGVLYFANFSSKKRKLFAKSYQPFTQGLWGFNSWQKKITVHYKREEKVCNILYIGLGFAWWVKVGWFSNWT